MENNHTNDEKILFSGVVKLHATVIALAFGLLGGSILFIATNWLIIKGGDPVGPHLQLLNQYFPGYRVSFAGSLIGFFYGFATGALCGLLIAWIYNGITKLRNGGL